MPAQAVHERWILFSVVIASGIVFLDTTVVNVALASIGRDLPATILGTLEGQAYVASGYLAVLAALLVLAGAMTDRYGRRRVFTIGLTSFGLTSVACGLAPTLEILVVCRLAQGAAGALLIPGALAIITSTFGGAERARAIGTWTAATAALLVLGPLVGGLLVDTLSWRAAFLVNVPLLLLALYGTRRYVPESRDPNAPRRLDWVGSLVIALAVGGVSLGIVLGRDQGWSDPLALAVLGMGVLAAVALPILMLRRPDPLIPPQLFRRREFAVINLATLLIYAAFYATSVLQSLFLQGVLGYTALAAALVALPPAIFLSLGSTRVGRLAGRVGPWPFLLAGPLLMAAALLWLSRIPATSGAWLADVGLPATLAPPQDALLDVLPFTLLYGAGLLLVVAPLTTALMSSVPEQNAGLGSAINNAISRVGQPLVMAVLFVVISAAFTSTLQRRDPALLPSGTAGSHGIQPLNPPPPGLAPAQRAAVAEASTEAFRLSLLLTAGLLVAGAAVNGLGLPRRSVGGAPATNEALPPGDGPPRG